MAAAPTEPKDGLRPGSRPVQVLGVRLTSPGKPLWPACDGPADGGGPVTKLELARYYEAVGPWMLDHVRGRPCSLVRAPDGLDGEHFFQRHPGKGASPRLTAIMLPGDDQPYIGLDSVAALIAAAQISAVELHPCNGRPGAPDLPGRLVFDLDPGPGAGFDAIVEAAREVRDRLADLGLASFCKTSGGKGLHVVAPLSPTGDSPGWPAARAFAREVCARMAADAPDRYLIALSKARRPGRVFLDYLRNDRMSTAVAPLSPRARPGAPVSMPLDWSQVVAGLDPMRFTLRTAPGQLAGMTAWRGYDAAARPLSGAIDRLAV